jgi:hypothetical protein
LIGYESGKCTKAVQGGILEDRKEEERREGGRDRKQ